MKHKAKCSFCGGNNFFEHTNFFGTSEFYKRSLFSYAKCTNCYSILNLTTNSPDYSDYPTGTSISKKKVKRFSNFLKRNSVSKNELILDYGCGNGALVKALRKEGFSNIRGYEPYHPKLSSTLDEKKKYSTIYLTHVFEHIPNYKKFFADLQKITQPGAKIITIHPSSNRIGVLNPQSPFQKFAIHAPFHTVIPADQAVIRIFAKNGYQLKLRLLYDIQRSGIKDNSRVTALLAQSLGKTKERWLGAPLRKKVAAVLESPWAFFDSMFLNTRDYLTSTFVFEKK